MKRSAVSIMLLISVLACSAWAWGGADKIDMATIKALALRPVDEVLANSPVSKIEIGKYWKEVRSRNRPMIVFFYSNIDGPSQRLATLVLYVAKEYANRIDFRCVKVIEKDLPSREESKQLDARFSLDSTPGVLFYDNVGDKLVLEQEGYINADYKEFRTPQMLLWKTYYAQVEKQLNKLLAD
jgi:thiol-disulfide isomerase/thioredoxin